MLLNLKKIWRLSHFLYSSFLKLYVSHAFFSFDCAKIRPWRCAFWTKKCFVDSSSLTFARPKFVDIHDFQLFLQKHAIIVKWSKLGMDKRFTYGFKKNIVLKRHKYKCKGLHCRKKNLNVARISTDALDTRRLINEKVQHFCYFMLVGFTTFFVNVAGHERPFQLCISGVAPFRGPRFCRPSFR